MHKNLLSTAAALGIMAASSSGLANQEICNVLGFNADHENSVVFSIIDGRGKLDSSSPVNPGESFRIEIPCGEEVIIGATPLMNQGGSIVTSNHNYAGLYTYKGGPVRTGTQISVVFPVDFDIVS